MSRFLRAAGRVFQGLNEREWTGPFFFAQLADTQYGLQSAFEKTDPDVWKRERQNALMAVEKINKLKPKFVVVCGDLVNAFPSPEDSARQQRQVADFKEDMDKIDKSIALVCLCGNHDIGDRPNAATISLYKTRFGDDYCAFHAGGVRCIVLNSQLHKDCSDAQHEAAEQDRWLERVLQEEPTPAFCLVFTHIPPFIEKHDEPAGYFNYDPVVRGRLLTQLRKANTKAWFCGHYHRNAGGHAGDLEVVITSAVGVTLKPSGTDPLGLKGFDGCECGPDTSGLRLVKVFREGVSHKWFPLSKLPDHVDVSTKTW